MTAKTATLPTIEPLSPGESSAWFGPIVDAYVAGAADPPESVRLWAHALNLAERSAAGSAKFRVGWEKAAIASHAMALQTGAFSAELTPEAIEAAMSDLAQLHREAELSSLRRDLLSATYGRLHDIGVAVLGEPSIMPSLKDAHEAVMAAVRELGPDVPTSDAQALDSPVEMVGRYRRLRDLSTRFLSIRAAWEAVRANPHERRENRDGHGWFADSPIGPGTALLPTTAAAIRRPGPDGLARLVWLANEGRGWLPSLDEENLAVDQWSAEVSKTRRPEQRVAALHIG